MTQTSKVKSKLCEPSRRFADNVGGLRVALEDSMMAIAHGLRHEDKHFREFAQKYGEHDESEGKSSWRFPPRYAATAIRLLRHANRLALGAELVPRSMVVALVSQFDVLLSGLMRALAASKPDIITHEDKSVTLDELEVLGSLEAVKAHFLEKEVESLLRKSHPEQFEWLEKRFSVKLRAFDSWPAFVEISQRRNLLVHADGRVSRQYLEVCKRHGYQLQPDIKEGELLEVPPAYWKASTAIVYEVGVKLSQVLWRKLLPDEIDQADDELNRIIYELLLHRRFPLAEALSKFAYSLPRHSNNEARLIMVVNHAIATEWQDRHDDCLRVLAAEDWSACAPKFLLANSVLEGDFDKAALIMRQVGASAAMEEAYQEWPLFRRFREDDRFKQAYKSVFTRDFENVTQDLQDMHRKALRKMLDEVASQLPTPAASPVACAEMVASEQPLEAAQQGAAADDRPQAGDRG